MLKAASIRVRKEERIFECAPEIHEFYFRDKAHRTPEYDAAMRCLHAFVFHGKIDGTTLLTALRVSAK